MNAPTERPSTQVAQHLPFQLWPFQNGVVDNLAYLDRAGLYLDVGMGKTITSAAIALFKMRIGMISQVVVIAPPILITNWVRTLSQIEGVEPVAYRGTPKQRSKIELDGKWVVAGYQIFKRDHDRFMELSHTKRVLAIADEAQALKNVGTDNYKKFRDFTAGHSIMLLTGTPISTPVDGYAMVKMVSPQIYKTYHQFCSIHVEKYDFFDRPEKFMNLDLLYQNLETNAVRILKQDVMEDLPKMNYNVIEYDLDPKHYKLYKQVAESEMVRLSNGDMMDFANASALFQNLNQLVCNAEFYSEGAVDSTIFELIQETLDEIGDKKLVIYTYYRRTSEAVFNRMKDTGLDPALVYGGTSNHQREIDKFISSAKCRVMVLAVPAGGAGVDGLQTVCHEGLFIELPSRAVPFHQSTGRLLRGGQKFPVNMRIALAKGTLQMRMWQLVLENDSLANMCVRGLKDIRDAVYGG